MKKLLALLLALAMLFTFAACGNSGSKDDDDKDDEKVEKDKDEDENDETEDTGEDKDEDKDTDKDTGKDEDEDKDTDKDTNKDEDKDDGKKEDSSDAYTKCVPVLEDILNGDFSQLESLAPKAYWDYAAEEFESSDLVFDMDEIISFNEDVYEEDLVDMEEYFGSNPTYKLSIEDSEKMSQDDLDAVVTYLADEGIDVDIKAGYTVVLKMELSGSEDSEEDTIDMYVIQVGNGWYPIYGEVDGEYTYVDFVAGDYAGDYLWQNMETDEYDEYDEYYY